LRAFQDPTQEVMPSRKYSESVNRLDLARFLERAQRRDCRREFHAVVGGGRLGAGKLFRKRAVPQDGRPTARTGIALASAVGVDDNLLHLRVSAESSRRRVSV